MKYVVLNFCLSLFNLAIGLVTNNMFSIFVAGFCAGLALAMFISKDK